MKSLKRSRATTSKLLRFYVFIMENKEIWKDIICYEGIYQVSNYGNVIRTFPCLVQCGLCGNKSLPAFAKPVL